MKHFLVTNDDGWDAPGLAALKLAAREVGGFMCWLLAIHTPMWVMRITTEAALDLLETSPGEFGCQARQSRCVRVAITSLFPQVDCVLSGINRGGNLGADLFISGTVAAAREAAFLGTPMRSPFRNIFAEVLRWIGTGPTSSRSR